MKNEIPDNLLSAIGNDDPEKVEQIINLNPELINAKNDIGWTILHYCAVWGSEKVFDWLYPQLKKPRLNMFDKHNQTPFHKAIIGPSNKIFETMLTDGRIEVTKYKKDKSFSNARKEAIFGVITKPEFKQRALKYFDFVDDQSTMWHHWFEQAMFEGRLWAVKLVFEQDEYKNIHDYYKIYGMTYAIRGDQRKLIEYVYKQDKTILESSENQRILSESLKWLDRFNFLIDLMPDKLDNPISSMYYDSLILDMINFKHAKKCFDIVNKKDILISDDLIKSMIKGRKFSKEFLQSCVLRSDYSDFILPILLKYDTESKYLPQEVKDIFSF